MLGLWGDTFPSVTPRNDQTNQNYTDTQTLTGSRRHTPCRIPVRNTAPMARPPAGPLAPRQRHLHRRRPKSRKRRSRGHHNPGKQPVSAQRHLPWSWALPRALGGGGFTTTSTTNSKHHSPSTGSTSSSASTTSTSIWGFRASPGMYRAFFDDIETKGPEHLHIQQATKKSFTGTMMTLIARRTGSWSGAARSGTL